MQWKWSLMVLAVLAFGLAAFGQIPVPGEEVILDPGAAVNNPAPLVPPGDPSLGNYSILVNAYIQPYARVTAYDNWILFGATEMNPTTGTFAIPSPQVAVGNVFNLVDVPDSTGINGANAYDLAGGRVETNSRLNMVITHAGFLTRVTDTGTPWAGRDTRKIAPNLPYQLANQYKIKFHGRFLQWAGFNPAFGTQEFTNPADTDFSVLPYVSPTSNTPTEYNTWTSWGPNDLVDNGINPDNGWLWPVDLSNPAMRDPWTGENFVQLIPSGPFDTSSPLAGYNGVATIPVIVERGQAQLTGRGDGMPPTYGDAAAAEWWIAERVLRRGLQDISGNYRTIIDVQLAYREAPVEWNP